MAVKRDQCWKNEKRLMTVIGSSLTPDIRDKEESNTC